MITSEPLVEAVVQPFENRATRLTCSSAARRSGIRQAAEEEAGKIKSKTLRLGNEALLNFVSLRSLAHYGESARLSPVEMYALRAPLTAGPTHTGNVCLIFCCLIFCLTWTTS